MRVARSSGSVSWKLFGSSRMEALTMAPSGGASIPVKATRKSSTSLGVSRCEFSTTCRSTELSTDAAGLQHHKPLSNGWEFTCSNQTHDKLLTWMPGAGQQVQAVFISQCCSANDSEVLELLSGTIVNICSRFEKRGGKKPV